MLSEYAITGDRVDCASWLWGHGAWEAEEMMDHRENLRRLVWLAGSALREDGLAYFEEDHGGKNHPELQRIVAGLTAEDEPGCEP